MFSMILSVSWDDAVIKCPSGLIDVQYILSAPVLKVQSGVELSFEFGLFETIAVFLSVLIANAIASDGKSNWLEGAMLLGTYAIMAAAIFLHA